jgi:ESX secretion system protein EccE
VTAFPQFRADPETLSHLGVNARGSGLIIGETDDHQAAAIDLLREEPTRAVVLGSLNLARTMAFRCLGLGARVLVSTWRPAPWAALAHAAGVGPDLLGMVGDGRVEAPDADEAMPLLVVQDHGSAPQETRIAAAPWRATLHVLNGLHPLTQHLLASADVLVLQQMDQRQGANVVRLLALPPQVIGRLSTLGPFQVLVVSRAGWQLVNLVSTPTEVTLLRTIGG